MILDFALNHMTVAKARYDDVLSLASKLGCRWLVSLSVNSGEKRKAMGKTGLVSEQYPCNTGASIHDTAAVCRSAAVLTVSNNCIS